MTQVLTATPGQLVVIVYDVAIRSLKMAKAQLLERRFPEANQHILKAQEAVTLLQNALNFQAGDLANKLEALYDFIKTKLINANVSKNAQSVEEALFLLEGLREAWAAIATGTGRR